MGEKKTKGWLLTRFAVLGFIVLGPAVLVIVFKSVPIWPTNALTAELTSTGFGSAFLLMRLCLLPAGLLGFCGALVSLIAASAAHFRSIKQPATRNRTTKFLAAASVFAGLLIAWIADATTDTPFRNYAISRVPMGLSPLVEALEVYQTSNGTYPNTLDELIPDLLDTLPTTRYPVYSDFTYRPPPENDPDTHFHIYIHPPLHGFGYPPGIAYCPDEDFPPDARHYLSNDRSGDWVFSPYEYAEPMSQPNARIWEDSGRIRE